MYKVVQLVKRAADSSVEMFQQRWMRCYRHFLESDPSVLRCVQNHPLPQGYRKKELRFDGVAEFEFESAAGWRAWKASDQARNLAGALAEMTAASETIELPVVIRVVKDGRAQPGNLKIIEFVNRRADLSFEAFQNYWWKEHGPLAADIPQLNRYEQNHVAAEAYSEREPEYDGLAVTWFDSTADMRAAATTEPFARAAADEPNFLSGDPVDFVIATEVPVKT